MTAAPSDAAIEAAVDVLVDELELNTLDALLLDAGELGKLRRQATVNRAARRDPTNRRLVAAIDTLLAAEEADRQEPAP